MEERKSPQQQLFDEVFKRSLSLGYNTVDYLPANDYGLPFVHIGEQFSQDLRTKDLLYGNVQQTINVYHNYRKRRELTTMVNNLKEAFRKIKHTENFYVTVKNVSDRSVQGKTGTERYWRGIIEVEFRFH
ncbi:hypothetical protein [Virgibacillus proomii]|uniref:hypothetical protein n=1 Tax=Virgibacillus proomii TaxID=84407 RepID=UPI00098541A7|nr:hypothetical protein [Virgibacillus proomii]